MQSRTFRVIPGLQSFDKCLNDYCAKLINPALMESYIPFHTECLAIFFLLSLFPLLFWKKIWEDCFGLV